MSRRKYETYCAKHMSWDDYLLYGKGATLLKGTQLPHAKLDEQKVKAVRANAEKLTAKQWADRLNVHVRTIQKVRHWLSWTHVT